MSGAPRTPQRGDIQGMRAVAVLLVVVHHAGFAFSGGYIGVDVFFVISGFLITGILVREVERSGRVSIGSFYARRAVRILPAATVVLLAVLVASHLMFNYVRVDEVNRSVRWSALFASNIHFALDGTDYFADTSFVSPVQHFWSLAVEEQFYLVWPPLIAGLLWVGRRRGNTTAAQSRRLMVVGIAVVSAASLVWSVRSTSTSPTVAYFSPLTRAWELGLGALVALSVAQVARWSDRARAAASWAGLGAIGVAAVSFTEGTPFPGSAALVPTVGTALLLAGGIGRPAGGAWLVLDRRPMRWVGDISYSLYLWHWPFLVMPAVTLLPDPTAGERLVLVGMCVAVSWLSYCLVETPFRRSPRVVATRPRALALWPAAVAVMLVACGGTDAVIRAETPEAAGSYQRPDVDPEPDVVQSSSLAAVNDASFAVELANGSYPLPASLHPSLTDVGDDNWDLPDECWANVDDTSHELCVSGAVDADRTIVAYGDSHVAMLVAPLVAAAEETGWRVIPMFKTGCPPWDAPMWRRSEQRTYPSCDTYREWAAAQLAAIRPDLIVTSGWVTQVFADETGDAELPGDESLAVFEQTNASALARLVDLAPRVAVIGAITNFPAEPKDCLAETGATMATCAFPIDPTVAARNEAWRRVTLAAGAEWVDPVPWVCSRDVCPMVIRDEVAYTDNHHLSATFAASLDEPLADALAL